MTSGTIWLKSSTSLSTQLEHRGERIGELGINCRCRWLQGQLNVTKRGAVHGAAFLSRCRGAASAMRGAAFARVEGRRVLVLAGTAPAEVHSGC